MFIRWWKSFNFKSFMNAWFYLFFSPFKIMAVKFSNNWTATINDLIKITLYRFKNSFLNTTFVVIVVEFFFW